MAFNLKNTRKGYIEGSSLNKSALNKKASPAKQLVGLLSAGVGSTGDKGFIEDINDPYKISEWEREKLIKEYEKKQLLSQEAEGSHDIQMGKIYPGQSTMLMKKLNKK